MPTVAKKNKKPKHGSSRDRGAFHVVYLNKTEEDERMTWNEESGREHEMSETRDVDPGADGAISSSGTALRALENLERFHDENNAEFSRMAGLQELGPQLRDALKILSTLPPQVTADPHRHHAPAG